MRVFLSSLAAFTLFFIFVGSQTGYSQCTDPGEWNSETTIWNTTNDVETVTIKLCDNTTQVLNVTGSGAGPYNYTAPTGKYIVSITVGDLTITSSSGTQSFNYSGNTHTAQWSTSSSTITLYLFP
ncbi:MAG: hypothetical protein KDD67_06205 [Ignavibacteriae bacterium]|nr:hypothetical protein [Ignavibacteriota bacterium]MCB9215293.1 hypothetical protein [Ignavibacteria bacterium]